VAAPEILYFFLAFSILIVGYAIGGWIIFGAAVPSYRTIPDAIVNSVNLVLLGDAEDWKLMRHVSPLIALVYYWSFVVMLLLVMLNVLLAILIDR
jgi:hypothetical protein